MPYRDSAWARHAWPLHAHVEATFGQLCALGLADELRVSVESTREAFRTGHADAVEVLLFLRRLASELDELPTELPALEDAVAVRLAALPARVAEPKVCGDLAVFRCDGHPMVRKQIEWDGVELHTSVRRGIPSMRALAHRGLRVEGASAALVSEVTLPLLRLGRVTRTSLSIQEGLATVAFRGHTDDEALHELAIACLVAVRGVHAPITT